MPQIQKRMQRTWENVASQIWTCTAHMSIFLSSMNWLLYRLTPEKLKRNTGNNAEKMENVASQIQTRTDQMSTMFFLFCFLLGLQIFMSSKYLFYQLKPKIQPCHKHRKHFRENGKVLQAIFELALPTWAQWFCLFVCFFNTFFIFNVVIVLLFETRE